MIPGDVNRALEGGFGGGAILAHGFAREGFARHGSHAELLVNGRQTDLAVQVGHQQTAGGHRKAGGVVHAGTVDAQAFALVRRADRAHQIGRAVPVPDGFRLHIADIHA
ncbi:MAG: hypothetical protein GMKNLPBB_03195 [Myxococcota bacterium]|nr:hypothetical protein [Myxococcota bacterium]